MRSQISMMDLLSLGGDHRRAFQIPTPESAKQKELSGLSEVQDRLENLLRAFRAESLNHFEGRLCGGQCSKILTGLGTHEPSSMKIGSPLEKSLQTPPVTSSLLLHSCHDRHVLNWPSSVWVILSSSTVSLLLGQH